MIVTTSEHLKDAERGEFLFSVVVKAASVTKDLKENIRNLIGGRMGYYEELIESAINEAIESLKKKALEKGYDGILGLKISNPVVVDGAAEVVVYGNGFKRNKKEML